jgi:hypothetical protein
MRCSAVLWDQQLFNAASLHSTQNEKVLVLAPGQWNQDQGPDFSWSKGNDRRSIMDSNREIHVKSSEWEQHGHQYDKNYDNVILHVVWEDDLKMIPTLAVVNCPNWFLHISLRNIQTGHGRKR